MTAPSVPQSLTTQEFITGLGRPVAPAKMRPPTASRSSSCRNQAERAISLGGVVWNTLVPRSGALFLQGPGLAKLFDEVVHVVLKLSVRQTSRADQVCRSVDDHGSQTHSVTNFPALLVGHSTTRVCMAAWLGGAERDWSPNFATHPWTSTTPAKAAAALASVLGPTRIHWLIRQGGFAAGPCRQDANHRVLLRLRTFGFR